MKRMPIGATVTVCLCLLACGEEKVSPRPIAVQQPAPPPPPAPAPPPAGQELPDHILLAGAVTGDTLEMGMSCTKEQIVNIAPTGDLTFSRIPSEVKSDGRVSIALPEPDVYQLDINGFGGSFYSRDRRIKSGPALEVFYEPYPELFELPWRYGEIDLKHATFASLPSAGSLCMLWGGLSSNGAEMSGTYKGFADGFAFIDGIVYRLYGSPTVIPARDSSATALIELRGRPYFVGSFNPDDWISLGEIAISLADGSARYPGFTGKIAYGPVSDGKGAAGHFELKAPNGDFIFGVVALDQE